MANNLSNYIENKLLDHIFRVAAFTMPAAVYIALSTADPTEAGSGLAEPVGNGYARVNASTTWAAAASGQTSNNAALTFPAATGSWGTITHVAILDASSGGNLLWYGPLTTSKAVTNGDTVSFPIGALVASLD